MEAMVSKRERLTIEIDCLKEVIWLIKDRATVQDAMKFVEQAIAAREKALIRELMDAR